MKLQNRFFSIVVAAVMVITSLPLTAFSADTVKTEDIILFGSYPQSKVSDEGLVSVLDGLVNDWVSYGYYGGTGIYDDGKMVPSDYMRYADIEYEGNKYRGVIFDEYRPTFTGYSLTDDTDTYQDIRKRKHHRTCSLCIL